MRSCLDKKKRYSLFWKDGRTTKKNITSTVQMTTVREHIKTTVAYRRNSTHFLRNQPGSSPPPTIFINHNIPYKIIYDGTVNASTSAGRTARHRVLIFLRPPPPSRVSPGPLKATASAKMVCLFISFCFFSPSSHSCSSSSPSSW